MSLSVEELDLIELLVAQVASLSSSLAMEVACKATIAEMSTPPVAHEVVDALVVITGSSTNAMVAMELQATGLGESFKVKPPDLAASEVCTKGVASTCSRWSAQLAAKCHGGTFKHPVPHHRLTIKVVSRRRLAHPRSCSLRPRHGISPSCHLYFAVAPLHCFSMSGRFLRSTWHTDVDAPCGRVGCCE
jgi:hypothetical protein